MAYTPMFPATYQPMYMQQLQGAPQQYPANQAQQASNIIWVCGEAGAKSYLVAPNTTVQLWDSESQTIYLKSADASGMPSIKVLDYTIRQEAPNRAPDAIKAESQGNTYKDDLRAIQGQIDALRHDLDELRKEADHDE